MDQSRADAIVQALLQPDDAAREERRRKRAAEMQRQADGRLVAWSAMPGFAIGAIVAYATDNRVPSGIFWGGMLGGCLGWLIVAWRRRRRPRPEVHASR